MSCLGYMVCNGVKATGPIPYKRAVKVSSPLPPSPTPSPPSTTSIPNQAPHSFREKLADIGFAQIAKGKPVETDPPHPRKEQSENSW